MSSISAVRTAVLRHGVAAAQRRRPAWWQCLVMGRVWRLLMNTVGMCGTSRCDSFYAGSEDLTNAEDLQMQNLWHSCVDGCYLGDSSASSLMFSWHNWWRHLEQNRASQVHTSDDSGAALQPDSASVWLTLHGRYLDGARHVLSRTCYAFGRYLAADAAPSVLLAPKHRQNSQYFEMRMSVAGWELGAKGCQSCVKP